MINFKHWPFWIRPNGERQWTVDQVFMMDKNLGAKIVRVGEGLVTTGIY